MSTYNNSSAEECLECDEILVESPLPTSVERKKRKITTKNTGNGNSNASPSRELQPSTSGTGGSKKRFKVVQSKNNAGTIRGRHFMVVLPTSKSEEAFRILENKCVYYIGQQERGNEGSEHYQLVVGFGYQKTVSAVSKMLNIQTVEIVRDLRSAIMYCTKLQTRIGDIMEFGDVPNTDYAGHNKLVLEASKKDSYEEAMAYLEDADLMFFLSHKKTIGPWLSSKFRQDVDAPLYEMSQFNKSAITNFSKTIVLIGPTGVGKTQYALAHFNNPLLIRDKNDYIRYNRHTDGIIFDDLAFTSWNPMTFLHMVENETPITQDVKFGHVRIRANIPKFILVNSEELLWPRDIIKETKDACLRRMIIFNIRAPLFNKQVFIVLFSYICLTIVIDMHHTQSYFFLQIDIWPEDPWDEFDV